MSDCPDGVCGTGGWTGPLPGDPDNTVSLSATSVFDGIEVSWSYPGVNPHAVAHTLLYRGVTSVRESATERAVVAGNRFLDPIEPANLTYYYWIRIVSINGTVGDWIGPASATTQGLIEDLLEKLTGEIDAGHLAMSLKTEIDKITLNHDELLDEITNRLAGDSALSDALADLDAGLTDAVAMISTESSTRTDGFTAVATQIDALVAANDDNAAAILTETTVRVAEDEALSEQITLVAAATDDNAAAILSEATARTDADSALASAITTAQSTLEDNIASVQTTLQTNIDTVDGEVTNIGALYTAKVGVNGLVGGFGIYNDGTEVDAGFDVDEFWVGRTGPDKIKPFIVDGGVVYINEAVIKDLTFSKLKDATGNFVVDGSGQLKVGYIDTKGMQIKDHFGNVIFSSGTGLDWYWLTNKPAFGALALANNVSYSSVTGTKPPTNADNTASNTAAGIAGQGALATANYASIGSTVRFPSGAVMNTSDFVNTLSKIGTGNISSFMESAAIGNAYIGNAAVGTLTIAGNAVTVPQGAYTAGSVNSTGAMTVQSLVVVATGAPIILSFGCHLYSPNHEGITMKVFRDSTEIFSKGPGTVWGIAETIVGGSFVTTSIMDTPSSGTYTYSIYVYNHNGIVLYASNRFITAIQAKR